MSGYFQTLAALKFAIRETEREIRELEGLIKNYQERLEGYRNILSDPQYEKDLSDPNFREAENIKQQAYWDLGETKYQINQATIEKNFTKARRRFYKSQMKELCC